MRADMFSERMEKYVALGQRVWNIGWRRLLPEYQQSSRRRALRTCGSFAGSLIPSNPTLTLPVWCIHYTLHYSGCYNALFMGIVLLWLHVAGNFRCINISFWWQNLITVQRWAALRRHRLSFPCRPPAGHFKHLSPNTPQMPTTPWDTRLGCICINPVALR